VQHYVDLSAYVGVPHLRFGFLAVSAFGNDCHIDDVVFFGSSTLTFLPMVTR
jgi:hypothetical protein